MIKSQLVDMRNWADLKTQLVEKIAAADIVGFDIETHDEDRHPGLTQFMKEKKKLVFDVNRTTVTGFSFYVQKDDTAYYVNLAHADVENRIPWEEARALVDAKKPEARWVAHNAPFELTMMWKSLGVRLGNIVCTLQMAVSHHNEDQYPIDKMASCGFGKLPALFDKIATAFIQMEPELTEEQQDLVGKIVGKASSASFSYNSLVRELGYGYGLKKLVKSLFGYEQETFEQVLNGKEHMGKLTGEEVCHYGADDAYWTVRVFEDLLPKMARQNTLLVTTFFEQENPMVHVFADIWSEGLRLDADQVLKRRDEERRVYADTVRTLQAQVRDLLPFNVAPNEKLMELEGWYQKNHDRYRDRIETWADLTLPSDPFQCAYTTAGAVTNAWATEGGLKKSPGPNFSHYMMLRTLLYDLCGIKVLISEGKVQSDAGARARMKGKNKQVDALLETLEALAGIEQRMKLYLTPYLQLLDPDTGRVYPVVSSKLNSRRMAMSTPNGMQLAKRGESTYVRGFYQADEDDHVIVSIDWSQVELVEIGDFSGDPGFAEAYGQIPFKDLHWKATAAAMNMSVDEVKARPDAKKLRTSIGKGSNFNYWYSGALSTVGQAMGWSSDEMWEKTEAYRQEFAIAEEWRVDLINEARSNGYITLPDGHRRVKFEASYQWRNWWNQRFEDTGNVGLRNFAEHFTKAIHNRAGNQIVNSMIQGSCATLAKRSIIGINRLHNQFRFRFMMPIHDELVFSVHRDDAIAFIREAKKIMCHHPDIITRLQLDATASIGRNFEPFHPEKAPFGQIEIDEAPQLPGWLPENTYETRLGDPDIAQVINYLFQEDEHARTAAQ